MHCETRATDAPRIATMRRFCQAVAVATIVAGGGVSSDARAVVARHLPEADVRPFVALLGVTALATYAAFCFTRAMNDDPRRR